MRRASVFAAVLALTCALPLAAHGQVTRNMIVKSHRDDFTAALSGGFKYSSCWGYVHGDGREYALIGTVEGAAIYNVTDPVNAYLVKFIPGPNSIWRNIKAYREWVYVTSEGPGPLEGMQVISMADPENPVLTSTYTATFSLAHTMHVDTTRALLFVNGPRMNAGGGSYPNVGTQILSLANPGAPAFVGTWNVGGYPTAYAHDSFERGNRLFLAGLYAGRVRVLDNTNPAAPFEITSWPYAGAFTHNLWTDTTGTVLYVTDETQGEPIKVFDIADLMNPTLANTFTPNPHAILHNVHVRGDELYIAGYSEGVRVLDISDPIHPAEFATADTYAGLSGGYDGVWEVFPYFPSGLVVASDIETGLYVMEPVRDYGVIRVNVIDADTQLPVDGADVFLTTQGDSLRTPADGVVQFGPSPGAHSVLAEKFGWTRGSADVVVANGSRDTVTIALHQKALVAYTGTVRDAMSLAPLEDTDVEVRYTSLGAATDVAGAFTLSAVPDDIYALRTHSPGHIPSETTRRIGPGFEGPATIDLVPAPYYDDLETVTPWTVGAPGDDAVTGIWVRVEPLGTGQPQPGPLDARRAMTPLMRREEAARTGTEVEVFGAAAVQTPGDVQNEYDRTPGAGQFCFITGQGTNPGSIGQNDVDAGRTSLTTPAMDLSAMADPHVGWWQWFYASGNQNDWLAVRISNNNGTTWTDVDTLRGPALSPRWEERWIRVADYITPTSQMKLRFVAADLPDAAATVEAAIDDLIAWDQAVVAVSVAPTGGRTLRFRAPHPNPATGEVTLALDLPRAGVVEVGLFDVSGRLVRTLHRGPAAAGTLSLHWDGAGPGGRPAPAGLYFVRAFQAGETAHTRLVRVE